MNWSLILIGLVALSSAALAENSYLVILPKLLKVGYDNQVSVFIAAATQPVEIKFDLMVGRNHVESKATCKPGETRNITLTLPAEFPVGAGELVIIGTGGIQFEERRDIVVYDNRHVILVQTSASTYRPSDTIEARVVVTNENLMPMEMGEVTVEVYDAALKLVSEFRSVPVRSGLTETLRIPIARHCNMGSWLVSATIENTTSSVEILVSTPVTPSFDLKAIFPRFLLRTDKMLTGSIEMDNDESEPIFGRGFIAIGQITEQEVEKVMKMPPKPPKDEKPMMEEWRKWKSQKVEIAGRLELNYDLMSLFNIDVSKCLAVQVYIQVTDLISGQERIVRHVIPVFTRDIMYDIRPLEFHAGMKNEFQVIAKRPDGKPIKMENMIVTVRMMMGDEKGRRTDEKMVEIKDFYTRGRNDIGFFNVEIPETCIGVLMTLTPLSEDGQVRGYRTHAIPLMPRPRRRDSSGAKLTIELLPSTVAPVNTDVNVPVVSSQISTIGRVSNFYVQLLPMKPVEKFERLPMSYILMTNGRITLTGEFFIEPTKECQSKQVRAIRPEEQMPPVCVFNGTLPIHITREMVPYSTLIVYSFQPSFGYHVIESYRFSVAGLFQSSLTLDAKVVPFTPMEKTIDNSMFMQDWDMKSMKIPTKVQDRTRVELSFTGTPDSTVGLNVVEYDSTLEALSNDMTKERLLKYLTSYERVPFVTMPVMPAGKQPNKMMMPEPRVGNMPNMPDMSVRTISEKDEEMLIQRERMGSKIRYPIETLFFGLSSSRPLPPLEGDDIYTTSNMGRLYDEEMLPNPKSHYRRKFQKSMTQYDVTIGDNDEVVATSMPLIANVDMLMNKKPMPPKEGHGEFDMHHDEMPTGERPQFGTPDWYTKMHTKLSSFSEEAFTLMQSGLTVVSDFDTLRIPTDMKRENLGKIFKRFREDSMSFMEGRTLGVRDEARQLLEEYIAQSDLSMMPPPIVLEEQSRTGYHRSLFFNTSRIESQGTGKVVLPQMKPYTTWLATGFAVNAKAGLSMAQPIRLPTTQGLYILGNTPKQVHVGENILLTMGINNYLNKDVNNVMIRIRASNDFDLMEESKPEQVISMKDKDYTMTIPSMKMMAVEIRNMIWVPKRCGMMQMIIEVESEFGGDYEVLTMFVHGDGIKREELSARLFDLTGDKKPMGPMVEKISDSPNLRSVQVAVSGTGLDRFVHKYTVETNALVGVDRAIVRLYRSLALRRYLNETQQTETPLFNMTLVNITKAYQKLQLFNDYDGSYSIVSDEGTRESSLYLTSLAFGAMISPMMPFRDNVTLNRTLTWILSHQQEDGSFEDNGPCFHYRFCASEFRRESLTAIVLYSLTRDNSSMFMPEFIRHRLFDGETSPIRRAQRYLESRVPDVKPHLLTITLFEMAFIQNRELSSVLRGRIQEALLSRKLTVVPEDGSRYIKVMDDKMTFDDQTLLNAMTLSIYGYYNDWQTVSDMARWVVSQVQIHPHYDTVLDAVFRTEAWLKVDCLFRKQFPKEKFAITVDVTADNGEKRQIKIDWKNMDITQKIRFALPVHQITYSVSGFGIAAVCVREIFVEKEQKMVEQLPFQLTHEMTPMSWLTEIKVKTCMTYTPTPKDMLLAVEKFNRTIVMEMELPSGMRINERQMGFLLSRVPEVMYFTYSPCGHKLRFFFNVPSTVFGKPICVEWCLERLSTVMKWTPMEVRVYDYLQQERQLVRLFPMQFQPTVLGYTFVDAAHKVRPSLEAVSKMQKRTEM